ncbi:molybdopterin biosynthesis protein [Cytophagales bacterium WSM2-2]|nr:molybdopterin biosynthesis protein [Cytophagales bacterium WSM2-2]
MDNKRYITQIAVPEIGFEGQEKIVKAKVLVVGAGGLGCAVLSYIVGMGVGTVGIADDDTVHISNLHRQILYNESHLGRLKTEVASQQLQLLNSNVDFNVIIQRIAYDNVDQFCSGYDVVVDCTDNYESRKMLDSFCFRTNTPLVFGAVQQFEGLVSVFSYHGGHSYLDLFPDEIDSQTFGCAQEGVMGHVAGYVGCLMTNEIVKIIIGLDNVLSGKVLSINMKSGTNRLLSFREVQGKICPANGD